MGKNTQNTALLVMDVQNATVRLLKESESYLATMARAIKTARAKNIAVLYVVVGFRDGYPEISTENKTFGRLKENPAMKLDTEHAVKVHAKVAPERGDVIVVKKRVSAFTGSDLEVLLRAMGIRHIVLSGIATSGVVLSTLREAADKDYTITVLSDGCADADEEVHRVLTTKIFPRQAEVLTVDEWAANMK